MRKKEPPVKPSTLFLSLGLSLSLFAGCEEEQSTRDVPGARVDQRSVQPGGDMIPPTEQDISREAERDRSTADQRVEVDMSLPDQAPLDRVVPTDAFRLLDLEVPPELCEPAPPLEPPPPSLELKRFSLALFHYNVEYVIGGLRYIDDYGMPQYILNNRGLAEGWDDDAVEDWIITETLDPILRLFEAHPTWGVDIELQGLMVEVMAARHPEVLDRLRRLNHRGQVELISFHQSAQLFLAFPVEDLRRSVERTKEVFAAHCLRLSPVVFNQEGQAGPGRQRRLVEWGYEIGVYPKNLWRYAQGDGPFWPWYRSEEGDLIVGPGAIDPASGIEVSWSFFDDGELRSVPEGINPYTAPLANQSEARVRAYEERLLALEAEGHKITTIGDYVAHLRAQEVNQPEAPALVDGSGTHFTCDALNLDVRISKMSTFL